MEISLIQNGLTGVATCSPSDHSMVTEESAAKASKISRDRWQSQVIGQGVLLVTEHNAEIRSMIGDIGMVSGEGDVDW